jgi:hypothetical protein
MVEYELWYSLQGFTTVHLTIFLFGFTWYLKKELCMNTN